MQTQKPQVVKTYKCKECGNKFDRLSSLDTTYCCGDKCSREYRECSLCDKPFYTDKKQQIYCSGECRYEDMLIKYHASYVPKGRHGRKTLKNCHVCGKKMQNKKYAFCSTYCQWKYVGKSNPNPTQIV